jgi:hypothetical protein
MLDFLSLLIHALAAPLRTQARLEAEIIMLRHQLNVLRRQTPRPRLTAADRLLFVWLCRLFPSLRNAITIVQPDTVLRWHRSGFRLYWQWKSWSRGGRPKVPIEVRTLIRRMSVENPLWGRTTHSRRVAEARDRGRSVDRRQVYGQEPDRRVRPDVEDVPAQSRGRHRHREPCRRSVAGDRVRADTALPLHRVPRRAMFPGGVIDVFDREGRIVRACA